MHRYEYKIVPAPRKGRKGPKVKGAEARFAYNLELTINALASEGWEYVRADVLPSEERQGLTSSQTVYRSILVFRRAFSADAQERKEPPLSAQEEPELEDANAEIEENQEEDLTDTEALEHEPEHVEEHWDEEPVETIDHTRG